MHNADIIEQPNLSVSLRHCTSMPTSSTRKPSRNVEVFDFKGAVIAGFWQCGTLQWDEFYRYIWSFFDITLASATAWRIFQYAKEQQKPGELCRPDSSQIVQPGHYILLSETRDPFPVIFSTTPLLTRNPTQPNTPVCQSRYRDRARHRDGTKCLVTGVEYDTHTFVQAAHVFPRAHFSEWVSKDYPSKITDTADDVALGGDAKIDSLQNIISMRADLHLAWDNYEFGVNPNNNYRITSFTKNTIEINGNYLQLNHIQDPTIRPLNRLFEDHFTQGLLKHVKGTGKEGWAPEDYEDTFGEGSCLPNPKVWGTDEGKERFELLLADKLFGMSIGCA